MNKVLRKALAFAVACAGGVLLVQGSIASSLLTNAAPDDGQEIVVASYPALDGANAEFRKVSAEIAAMDEQFPGEVMTDAVINKMNEANTLLVEVKNALEDGTFDADTADANIAEALSIIADAKAMADANLADAKSLPSGEYYLKTTYGGEDYYFGPSNSRGTQASLVEHSVAWQLAKLETNVYTLESVVNNGGTAYYFNGSYCDNGNATPVYFTPNYDGTYLLSMAADDGYIVVTDAEGAAKKPVIVGSGSEADALRWTIVSTATDNIRKGDDVTYLIKDADFGRNNRHQDAWQVSDDCTNSNLSDGTNENRCAESYHSVFTISQTIEGVPNGYYTLTAQGFYRQDGTDNEHLPVFFANADEIAMPQLTGTENRMSDASTSFANGLYAVSLPISVTDGKIDLGVRLAENKTLWVIWDNFGLIYDGDDDTKYVAYNNEQPHDELVAALEAVRQAFAEAKAAVAAYDEFVQNAVKADGDELTILLQDNNVTHEEEVKDEAGNVTDTKTVTDREVVNQKIAQAYAAKECAQQKDALMAEIAAIGEKVEAYAKRAEALQTGNDDSYAKLRAAYDDLVAQWQTAYDQINTEFKEYIDNDDVKYNGYLKQLNTAYVSVDALDATIEGYKEAGSCQANEAKTLQAISELRNSIADILATALNSYNSDVATANAAAYAAVNALYEEKVALYKQGILDVSEHYAAQHSAAATEAQVALFDIYDWINDQFNAATQTYTTIEASNKAKFDAQAFPLDEFDNTDYITNLNKIQPKNVEAIMAALENKAADEHNAKAAAYTAKYDQLMARCEALEQLIGERQLTATDYAEAVAQLKADILAVQPYLFTPLYNQLTMTVQRRNATNDHITLWSVYGSDDAEAADDEWKRIATLSTPYTSNDEVINAPFANLKNYQYLRFYIDGTAPRGKFFGHLSEFQLSDAAGTALITDVAQLSSPFTQAGDGQGLPALIDGNTDTYWHSQWQPEPTAAHTHYLQVALPEPTHALPHSLDGETWACDVLNANTIETLLATFEADIDDLATSLDTDYSSNLLTDICQQLDDLKTYIDAKMLPESDHSADLQQTFAEWRADLDAKAEAIRSEAREADAQRSLIGETYDALCQRIGAATDAAQREPDPVAIEMTAGDNSQAATVNGIQAVKCGTSSKQGSATLTIPAGVTTVTFSAVAWKGIDDLQLTVSDGTDAGTATYTLQGNDGLAGNPPFAIAETEDMVYTYTFAAPTEDETTLTLTADKRFAVWGVSCDLEGEQPTVYAQANALAEAVVNEDIHLDLADAIATLQANSNNAKTETGRLGLDRKSELRVINAAIKNLKAAADTYYEAATLAANEAALRTRVEAIQTDIDALLADIYYADLMAQLAELKTTQNLIYAEARTFDDPDDSSIDEANDLIQDLGANVVAPLERACTKAQYDAAKAQLNHQADYYDAHAVWIRDEYPLGDANLNHEVTVADAILAVNIALDDEASLRPRELYTTDVNASGDITAADAVGIVNIALGLNVDDEAGVKAAVAATTDAVAVAGRDIILSSATPFVAFQMDITLDQPASLRGMSLSGRAGGMQLFSRPTGQNTLRVIGFSADNSPIATGDGTLVTIQADGNIAISKAEFIDARAVAHLLLDAATGIGTVRTDAATTDIYTVGGARTSRMQTGVNIVRRADGTTRKVLVK